MLSTARLFIVTLVVLACVRIGVGAPPPVFKNIPFDQALAESKKTGKVLVFDAMTSWCGPCKVMDKKTWVDPTVVAWLDANAICLQYDMDEHPDLRKRLEIHAYPTIIAFRDGGEFDRIVGSRTAGPLIEWLKGVKEGRSALAQTQTTLKSIRDKAAADPAAPVDCRLRITTARELVHFGQMEDAAIELEWLWRNIPVKCPQLASQRRGLIDEMATVARRHEPGRAAFTVLRDEAKAKAASGAEELRDWIALCGVIGDWDAVAKWAATMTNTPENVATLRSVEKNIFGVLIDKNQWAVAGVALSNPVRELEDRGAQLGFYDNSDFGASESDDAPAATPADTKPKTVPAIPMSPGGMKPAATKEPGAEPEAQKPKTIPAIPMSPGGMKPAKKPADSEPEASKPADQPKTIPAIPMTPGGMKPAKPAEPAEKKADEQPKSTPMIPLSGGGMKPAEKAVKPPKDTKAIAAEVRRRLTTEFRKQASEYYAACLAAGRADDAEKIVTVVMKYADDPMSRLRLVAMGLRAGQNRPEFVEWLADAHDQMLDSETFDFCTGKPKTASAE